MIVPLLLLCSWDQELQQQMSMAPTVTSPYRLAISPKIDGEMQTEEWDPLSTDSGVESYFQWEPRKLHLAAKTPSGKDLVVSFDLLGDGWLNGTDNLEVRVKWNGGSPAIESRYLDGSRRQGPAWNEAPSYRAATWFAAKPAPDGWFVELTVQDPGTKLLPEKIDHTIGLRVDAVNPSEALAEPFLPRYVAPLTLVMTRGTNLPTGLQWKPEFMGRSVVPGNDIKIRLTFNGTPELGLKRVEMRTEGLASDLTSTLGVPFPQFDNKGRSFVDYETKVAPDADFGYRVLQATLTDESGRAFTTQTSYEISPLVSFDFNDPRGLQASEEPQKVKLATYLRSNTTKRLDGFFRIDPPQGWTVESGDDLPFVIYNARGSKRQVFEVTIPGGFTGTAPIKLIADIQGKQTEQLVWVQIPEG